MQAQKPTNGMYSLIKRHKGLKARYIKGVRRVLGNYVNEGKPGAKIYERSAIYRVVHDITEINDESRIIREAFFDLCEELGIETGELATA